jgi:hypothetical protein
MILQDLIRNYILYRGVIRPILTAWKDSLTPSPYREIVPSLSPELKLDINKAKELGGGEELGWDISDDYEAMSLTKVSGTHTITDHIVSSMSDSGPFYEAQNKRITALSSKIMHTVLIDSSSINCFDGIGQTHVYSLVLDAKTTELSVAKTQCLTTGFESKQINSFLFETHEKREYLGEFSLTHEETYLIYLQKGGEYHDTDQESSPAII